MLNFINVNVYKYKLVKNNKKLEKILYFSLVFLWLNILKLYYTDLSV